MFITTTFHSIADVGFLVAQSCIIYLLGKLVGMLALGIAWTVVVSFMSDKYFQDDEAIISVIDLVR